jgi:hypothetical protein
VGGGDDAEFLLAAEERVVNRGIVGVPGGVRGNPFKVTNLPFAAETFDYRKRKVSEAQLLWEGNFIVRKVRLGDAKAHRKLPPASDYKVFGLRRIFSAGRRTVPD